MGPLILGPLSEIFGRSRVLQLANLWYLGDCVSPRLIVNVLNSLAAWNLGCAFAQNTGQILAFRFLAGLGGSAPLSIGGGVLGDCWRPEERGQAIALYSLAPLLGPVVGPVCAAWIAQRSTWRWVVCLPVTRIDRYGTDVHCLVLVDNNCRWLHTVHGVNLLARKCVPVY